MREKLITIIKISFWFVSLPWVIGSPIDPSPVVVEGDVSFSGLTTGDATITQETIKAIVDYDHFNVLAGDAVRFT